MTIHIRLVNHFIEIIVTFLFHFCLLCSVFQLLGECHCLWTSESPRAHVTKFYDRLRLIRSVLRASKFSVFRLIQFVILWVHYTIPVDFNLFGTFLKSLSKFWNYFVLLRITDDGSKPEMRIWSILLIKSDTSK